MGGYGTKQEAMQNIAKAGIKDRSKKLSPKFKLEMLQTKFVSDYKETSGDLLHNMDLKPL